jgi:hypothetical protein
VVVISILNETAELTRMKEVNYGVIIVVQEDMMTGCALNYIQIECQQKVDLDSIVNLKKQLKEHPPQTLKKQQTQHSM